MIHAIQEPAISITRWPSRLWRCCFISKLKEINKRLHSTCHTGACKAQERVAIQALVLLLHLEAHLSELNERLHSPCMARYIHEGSSYTSEKQGPNNSDKWERA
ncbi:hypothetical protein DUNSADRAFT_3326 [Dunaliella salina]|uniref:Encoded protein n=1 Tax=Dunaliella salina TaxID=3046 RepID=A0ABQ7FW30_DUNSA|nr:hypothetical protein DUNSADRAFT_3326 [Dunaliella salina]|eukprot:KAF5826392.1 hypothetical protein DUNSADRAFT_3326 [Dunaliella salina]